MEKLCKNQAYLALMQTSKAIQERIKIEVMKYDLNITEFAVLETLYLKGKQTIQQIAQSILISSGSMTYIIDKLEKKDLLNRKACPDDRRAIHIVLTEVGNDLMNQIMPKHQELIDEMFSSLNEEQEKKLVGFLKDVSQKVEM